MFNINTADSDEKVKGNLGLIVFYFMPTIFLVVIFSLMYYQLEMLMTMSRISSGEELRAKKRNQKIALYLRAGVFTVMGIFGVT